MLQYIINLFKRKLFANPQDNDILYLAKKQNSGLESRITSLKSVKDWVLSGVDATRGAEPFKRDIIIYPLQITRGFGPRAMQSRSNTFTLDSSSLNYAQPFWVQQKVNLTMFRIEVSIGHPTNIGCYVIYKYDSEVTQYDPFSVLNFSLVYQSDPQALTTMGIYTELLSTPVTLVPGEVYIAMFAPETTLPTQGIVQQYDLNPANSNIWDVNKFLGGSTSMAKRMTGLTASIQLGPGPTYTAPATIQASANQGEVAFYEYLQIGLKNA